MSNFLKMIRLAALGLAGLAATELPAFAGSCHAHAHSHDQCGWHTRSRTKSGGAAQWLRREARVVARRGGYRSIHRRERGARRGAELLIPVEPPRPGGHSHRLMQWMKEVRMNRGANEGDMRTLFSKRQYREESVT